MERRRRGRAGRQRDDAGRSRDDEAPIAVAGGQEHSRGHSLYAQPRSGANREWILTGKFIVTMIT